MSTASPRSKAASGLVVRVLAALIVASAIVVALAGPASAHIGLSESDPVNVSTVEGPVSEIRLAFTGAADAVEDQFALTAGGVEVRIASIENDGADVLVVTAEEPLATGRVKLNWAIRSGDSHTMTGSITFTVATASDSAPAAAATPTPGSEAQPQSSGSAATDDAVSRAAAGLAAEQTGGGAPAKGPADHVATAARWLVYGALLFCVGGLGYLAWVHRGTAAEGRGLVFYVRRAALVVMVGAVVEWLAQVVLFGGGELEALWSPTAWGDVLAASFSAGTVLRLVGAGLVLAFLASTSTTASCSMSLAASTSPSSTTTSARPALVRLPSMPDPRRPR